MVQTGAGYHTVWLPDFFLPFLHSGSGTSRFANHNTVGIALALPSLHAIAVSHLSSLFPPYSVYFGCPCLFPNGNFEVDWCCLFRGEWFHAQRGWDEGWAEVWAQTPRSHRENEDFTQQWCSSKTASMCSLFSVGGWSQMEQSHHWLTQRTSA